ncbi:MAG: transcriptional repressor [Candidatus Competibacteraceae bacterium]|nr:transcriptional repressor [Candidatus Competibacteraceae bacterium]
MTDPTALQTAMAQAEQLCRARGVRLTALRRRVLELVLSSDTPQGAYAILDTLRLQDGRAGAPPTVYRALDFLLEQGLIHRLASCNVFIGCCQPTAHHSGQFLICRSCGKVAELDSQEVEKLIRKQAQKAGFRVESQMVEIAGYCQQCQQQ